MITLYIDTHSEKVVFALYKEEILLNKLEILEPKDHSTICMPTLISLLKKSEIKIEEVNDIVVVIGPGSFTGVRIGVTIAKTLSFIKKIPIRTLTSLELFLPGDTTTTYISLKEKNGFFIGKMNEKKNKILEYQYLKKEDYLKFKEKNKILEAKEVNYQKIISYAHQKEPVNPHQVNPFYVKKIEVEK